MLYIYTMVEHPFNGESVFFSFLFFFKNQIQTELKLNLKHFRSKQGISLFRIDPKIQSKKLFGKFFIFFLVPEKNIRK